MIDEKYAPHELEAKWQKEWEEKLKTSWETITSIYQPIMIN